MICPVCKTYAASDDIYCSHCGQRLVAAAGKEMLAATQKAMSLSDVRYRLGMVYYRKGDLSSALAVWKKALETDVDNPDIRTWIERAEQELSEGAP